MDFKSNAIQDGTNVTLTMSGRLDTLSATRLTADVKKIISRPFTSMTVDTSALEYISSSGLRCFVDLYKASVNYGATFTVTGLQPAVREIFDLTGFTKIFSIN